MDIDFDSPRGLCIAEKAAEVMRAVQQDPSLLRKVGKFGDTLLCAAVQAGNLDLVRSLLQAGADPNFPSGNGALIEAIKTRSHNRLEMVRALLDHGADPNARSTLYQTALHAAVGEADAELVNLLLDRGADVNIRGEDDMTPLWTAACIWKNADMVRLLLTRGANCELRGGPYCTTLYGEVAESGNGDILELLTASRSQDHSSASDAGRAGSNAGNE